MRHRKTGRKLGRTTAPRQALMSALVCSLIEEKRIKTTLPKAKRPAVWRKMVTLGREGTLAARRRAISTLHQEDKVATLFGEIAPAFADRHGGYCRILKLGRRTSDGSEMAYLEWVGIEAVSKKRKPKKDVERNEVTVLVQRK